MIGGRKDCKHEGASLVRVYLSTGAIQARLVCSTCGAWEARQLQTLTVEVEALPIFRDDRATVPPCVVCGARGTEDHHWAPRNIFGDEAFLWPTSRLCQPCHAYWHTKMDRYDRTGR